MQTRNSGKIVEEREIELENIIGNLLIAEYQVQKLRSRLTEKIGEVHSALSKNKSSYTFKHNSKWYRVSVRVDEMDTADKISETD
ncbi:MAG TPA: hypothetical protein VD736_03230 [Nitrososphaera sp.]|nr:hypothetical protein [Nitrososphaera sp.]